MSKPLDAKILEQIGQSMVDDLEARYAEIIEGSFIVVRFRPGRRDPQGWHLVLREWPAVLKRKPLRIGHARSKINADKIADEYRALDILARRGAMKVAA